MEFNSVEFAPRPSTRLACSACHNAQLEGVSDSEVSTTEEFLASGSWKRHGRVGWSIAVCSSLLIALHERVFHQLVRTPEFETRTLVGDLEFLILFA